MECGIVDGPGRTGPGYPMDGVVMVQHTETTLVDDHDGSTEGVETRTFFDPFTGQERAVDLTDLNHVGMLHDLDQAAPWVDVSRPAHPRAAKRAAQGTPDLSHAESQAVREWARSQGMSVADRGRLSVSVKDAWVAAGKPGVSA